MGSKSKKSKGVKKRSSSTSTSATAAGSSRQDAPMDGMCQVCTVVPYQFHHFGAFVCNRCRAFFRRTVRRSRRGVPIADCITTKKPLESNVPICDITLFRGACQACRYITCINVGMSPDSVLTDAVRSQKYAKKKPRNRLKSETEVFRNPQEMADHEVLDRQTPTLNHTVASENPDETYTRSNHQSTDKTLLLLPENGTDDVDIDIQGNEDDELNSQDQILQTPPTILPTQSSHSFKDQSVVPGRCQPVFSHFFNTMNYGYFHQGAYQWGRNGSFYYDYPVIDPPWIEHAANVTPRQSHRTDTMYGEDSRMYVFTNNVASVEDKRGTCELRVVSENELVTTKEEEFVIPQTSLESAVEIPTDPLDEIDLNDDYRIIVDETENMFDLLSTPEHVNYPTEL